MMMLPMGNMLPATKNINILSWEVHFLLILYHNLRKMIHQRNYFIIAIDNCQYTMNMNVCLRFVPAMIYCYHNHMKVLA